MGRRGSTCLSHQPQQQPSTLEAGNDCSLEGSDEPPKENIDLCLLPPPSKPAGDREEEMGPMAPKRKLRKQFHLQGYLKRIN